MDSWYGLTMDDIRTLEAQIQAELKNKVKNLKGETLNEEASSKLNSSENNSLLF